jgi:hypothetical protein
MNMRKQEAKLTLERLSGKLGVHLIDSLVRGTADRWKCHSSGSRAQVPNATLTDRTSFFLVWRPMLPLAVRISLP